MWYWLIPLAVIVYVGMAFGLAALNRGTDDRKSAHLVAWMTAFWPVIVPIAASAIIWGGVAKVGGWYIDFIHGEKKPMDRRF